MDVREYLKDEEEDRRAVIAGILKHVWTAMPAQITEDTKDGHVATAQPTIKRQITDPVTGETTYEDHPIHVDVPIHHLGGGGVSTTHPNKQGDTGTIIYTARPLDTWFQSDGTQQPIDSRMHSLADGVFLSGARSIPRMLQQVSKDSTQTRSDDKKHVADLHPQNGITHKSVDPSTARASAAFDPFTMATKFYQHIVQGVSGILGSATDGGTTHTHGVTHGDGAFMTAANALHSVMAHPTNGASMNASNLLHKVLAHPDLGSLLSANHDKHIVQAHPTAGVIISSATAVAISAPSMSLPSGGVSAGALASGAASSNVGALGGDLSGTLPDPNVVGLSHVDAHTLPSAPDDAAAATAGVAVGGLYRNTTIATGVSVLCVRMA